MANTEEPTAQHLYSTTSKLVLRRGGPKQDPTLDGVSTEGM